MKLVDIICERPVQSVNAAAPDPEYNAKLSTHHRIRFTYEVEEGVRSTDYIEIKVQEDGSLQVMSTDALMVRPHSSNVIIIQKIERKVVD